MSMVFPIITESNFSLEKNKPQELDSYFKFGDEGLFIKMALDNLNNISVVSPFKGHFKIVRKRSIYKTTAQTKFEWHLIFEISLLEIEKFRPIGDWYNPLLKTVVLTTDSIDDVTIDGNKIEKDDPKCVVNQLLFNLFYHYYNKNEEYHLLYFDQNNEIDKITFKISSKETLLKEINDFLNTRKGSSLIENLDNIFFKIKEGDKLFEIRKKNESLTPPPLFNINFGNYIWDEDTLYGVGYDSFTYLKELVKNGICTIPNNIDAKSLKAIHPLNVNVDPFFEIHHGRLNYEQEERVQIIIIGGVQKINLKKLNTNFQKLVFDSDVFHCVLSQTKTLEIELIGRNLVFPDSTVTNVLFSLIDFPEPSINPAFDDKIIPNKKHLIRKDIPNSKSYVELKKESFSFDLKIHLELQELYDSEDVSIDSNRLYISIFTDLGTQEISLSFINNPLETYNALLEKKARAHLKLATEFEEFSKKELDRFSQKQIGHLSRIERAKILVIGDKIKISEVFPLYYLIDQLIEANNGSSFSRQIEASLDIPNFKKFKEEFSTYINALDTIESVDQKLKNIRENDYFEFYTSFPNGIEKKEELDQLKPKLLLLSSTIKKLILLSDSSTELDFIGKTFLNSDTGIFSVNWYSKILKPSLAFYNQLLPEVQELIIMSTYASIAFSLKKLGSLNNEFYEKLNGQIVKLGFNLKIENVADQPFPRISIEKLTTKVNNTLTFFTRKVDFILAVYASLTDKSPKQAIKVVNAGQKLAVLYSRLFLDEVSFKMFSKISSTSSAVLSVIFSINDYYELQKQGQTVSADYQKQAIASAALMALATFGVFGPLGSAIFILGTGLDIFLSYKITTSIQSPLEKALRQSFFGKDYASNPSTIGSVHYDLCKFNFNLQYSRILSQFNSLPLDYIILNSDIKLERGAGKHIKSLKLDDYLSFEFLDNNNDIFHNSRGIFISFLKYHKGNEPSFNSNKSFISEFIKIIINLEDAPEIVLSRDEKHSDVIIHTYDLKSGHDNKFYQYYRNRVKNNRFLYSIKNGVGLFNAEYYAANFDYILVGKSLIELEENAVKEFIFRNPMCSWEIYDLSNISNRGGEYQYLNKLT